MSRLVLLCLLTLTWACMSGRGAAHDLPGEVSITGYFETSGAQPELLLRVPLILLTNQNLAKRGPGYLDLARMGDGIARAESAVALAVRISSEGQPLVATRTDSRISLPSERSFTTAGEARRAILGPSLAVEENVFWNQGFFDIRMLFAPSADVQGFVLHLNLPPGIAERALVTLGITTPGASMRTLTIDGTTSQIALDPSWSQAGSIFLARGVEHILIGADHLLFLLCLILPMRRDPCRLLGVVTAFTLGHSATLIPAALGLAPDASWFSPVVETLIAASIFYMAVENVFGTATPFRWPLAFGFGLVHGFGFASTLGGVIPFAGAHLLTSLIFFNIGIELGQILALAVALPVLALVMRTAGLERGGIIVISVVAGHEAWHWMVERAQGIPVDLAPGPGIYEALVWAGALLVPLIGLWWLRSHRRGRHPPRTRPAE